MSFCLNPLQEHDDPREITPRMAEFLTLAEAVRGLKGQGSTVTHVGSPKPSASPAQAPAPAGPPMDRRDYWTADQDNSLLEASPIHSLVRSPVWGCPLLCNVICDVSVQTAQ